MDTFKKQIEMYYKYYSDITMMKIIIMQKRIQNVDKCIQYVIQYIQTIRKGSD